MYLAERGVPCLISEGAEGEGRTGEDGWSPQVYMFEQVSSDDHPISLAGDVAGDWIPVY